MSLVHCLSKKQPTIETSVFGAEFVALKHVMEALRCIRYKLRMMGVTLSGLYNVYGDNMFVIHNTLQPELTLRKKSNSICYNAVHESVAMGETKNTPISTHDNVSNLLTKVLYEAKRKKCVGKILNEIYDGFALFARSNPLHMERT